MAKGTGVPNRQWIIEETLLLPWKRILWRGSGDCHAQKQTLSYVATWNALLKVPSAVFGGMFVGIP